jgi:hypothetical protein
MKDLDFPILDIVTSEEIHRALLSVVLQRSKVRDPEKFLKEHAIESKVIFKNIKTPDGNQMTAAVVINKAVPQDEPITPSGSGDAKTS